MKRRERKNSLHILFNKMFSFSLCVQQMENRKKNVILLTGLQAQDRRPSFIKGKKACVHHVVGGKSNQACSIQLCGGRIVH